MLTNFLLVGIGGFAGSITRYVFYVLLERNNHLPIATFCVNMLGSLLLGFFIGYYMLKTEEPNHIRLLFAVGFCGSFTTFSTFAYENWVMLSDKNFPLLASYLGGSIILGVLMVFVGIWAGKLV